MERGVGMELNDSRKILMQNQLGRFGCLPTIQPTRNLSAFNALELAQAIEQCIQEAGLYGHSKVTLHFDLIDGAMLAQHLRRTA